MNTRLSTILSTLIIAATGIYAALIYGQLPASIPTHWNIVGKADAWTAKDQALALGFGLMIGMFLLMQALPWLSPKKFEIESFRPTFNYLIVLLTGMFGFIEVVALRQALVPVDFNKVLLAGLMLFLAAVGNLLGKVKRNFYVGVRTPWTLASESVWVATHRLAARLMFGAGVVGAIMIIAGVSAAIVFGLFIATCLYPVLYSFLLYKKSEGSNLGNGTGAALALLVVVLGASRVEAESVSRNIEFVGAGGFSLKGTLLVPGTSGKHPAMVLLPGSGPTDRDGNQPPAVVTDILKQVAERLAREGIVTLRFDKRAVAHTYMASYPKPAQYNDFFSWENFVEDGRKALAFLREQPEVDSVRTGMLGHSEGTLFSLQIGGEANGPKAIVLIACPGRALKDTVRDQIVLGLDRAPGMDKAKVLGEYDSALKTIDETGVVPKVSPMLQPLFPAFAAKYIRTFLSFSPTTYADKVTCPVFVVQGTKDIQVLVDKDMEPLVAALKSRNGLTTDVLRVEGGSHCLKLVHDETKEAGFAGPVIPSALDAIAAWVKKALG